MHVYLVACMPILILSSTDINECAAETSSPPCPSDHQCVDTVGSFKCVCPEGTFENGIECTSKSTVSCLWLRNIDF